MGKSNFFEMCEEFKGKIFAGDENGEDMVLEEGRAVLFMATDDSTDTVLSAVQGTGANLFMLFSALFSDDEIASMALAALSMRTLEKANN